MGDRDKAAGNTPSGGLKHNHTENLHAAGQSRVQIGDIHGGVHHHYPPQSVEPSQPSLDCSDVLYREIPFDRNEEFVGRESILSRLLEIIPPTAKKDRCQHTAIEGLGGIGKTQLALEAAFRVRERHEGCSIFWVPVLDVASFDNAYRAIGQNLKVEGIDNPNMDVKILVKTALSKTSIPWLLVVDNADDVNLLFGDAGSSSLAEYLPSSHCGSILFTTRNHQVVRKLDISRTNIIRVTEMERADAHLMLQNGLETWQTEDSKSTEELLDLLADLPLAIKQAASYMDQANITTTQYLKRYRSSDAQQIELLSKDFDDRTRDGNVKKAIVTTWQISFDHISKTHPAAAIYLQYMSLLSEKDISVALLPSGETESEVWEALATLTAYAFITRRLGQDAYDMHRLVRLVMRNRLERDKSSPSVYGNMIQHLLSTFPYPNIKYKGTWIKYLPHVKSALHCKIEYGNMPTWIDLNENAIQGYYLLGNYNEAEILARKNLKLSIILFGRNDHRTFDCMSDLGSMLRFGGKYNEAITITRALIELRKETNGEINEDFLGDMNGLAMCLRWLGKYEEAERMQQESLRLHKEILGDRHPSTLAAMETMGNIWRDQGKNKKSAKISEQCLKLSKIVLGEEHIDTLTTTHNFALSLERVGRLEEAERYNRSNLILQEKIFGKKHPETLATLYGISTVLMLQGRLNEAKEMSWKALSLLKEVLGSDHPDTLRCAADYAKTIRKLGDFQRAEGILQQTVGSQTKILGAEHPDTIQTMFNLASLVARQGRLQEAEKLFRQTLHLETQLFGRDHENTRETAYELARVVEKLVRIEETEESQKRKKRKRRKKRAKQPKSQSSDSDSSKLGKIFAAMNIHGTKLGKYIKRKS